MVIQLQRVKLFQYFRKYLGARKLVAHVQGNSNTQNMNIPNRYIKVLFKAAWSDL